MLASTGRSDRDADERRPDNLKADHEMEEEEVVLQPEPPAEQQRSNSSSAPWTEEEDQAIRDGVKRHGTKWADIVKTMPPTGRRSYTADALRKRWVKCSRRTGQEDAQIHCCASSVFYHARHCNLV